MTEPTKPYRKLWRSRRERRIAGVCGGLADYFSLDPFWIRAAFVLLFILGGSSLLVYVIMWLLIPLEPKDWH
ncbi:phage shock protein C, PspC [Legionella rubrilucens]|uniref:Phage shock protein C, PspC n=1 Tax=Legionella rubrilucens TaxID=458 RepID=A0A0W0XM21_9GAMM|nr:PspC domain-containing protein [Legionella rubrilucens]KTD45674.1 phage shock protein C, PspC [Legionella rubrilucens]